MHLSSVDLPAPFAPMMPTASPGSTEKSMSLRTHRQVWSFFEPRAREYERLRWSRRRRRPRSTRNRFQRWSTRSAPSADIGEARLESLEEEERADEPHRRHRRRDRRQLHVRRLAVEDRTAETVDHRGIRVDGAHDDLPTAAQPTESPEDRCHEEAELDRLGQRVAQVAQVHGETTD